MRIATPRTGLGRILPLVAGVVLVLGCAQLLVLARWGTEHGEPNLVVVGLVTAAGCLVTGLVLLTLGVMVRHQQAHLASLAMMGGSLEDHSSLLEALVKQNADLADIARRQIAFLERLAPEEPARRDRPAPGLDQLLDGRKRS
jgi:hypothetical protein